MIDALLRLIDMAPATLKSFIGGLVLVAGTGWVMLSKEAAERWGRLGAVARKMRSLRAEAVERDSLASEQRVSKLETRIEKLEAEQSVTHGWILWTTHWGHDVELIGARKGLTLPRFLTRAEWIEKGMPEYRRDAE